MNSLYAISLLLTVNAARASVLPVATVGSSYAAHAIDHSLALPAAPFVAAPAAAPFVAAPFVAAPAAAPFVAAPFGAAPAAAPFVGPPAPILPAPAPFIAPAAPYFAPPPVYF